MYNAVIKLSAITLSAIALVACGGKSLETIDAETMLAEARDAITEGNPQHSIEILDSLQKKYPSEIEVQREAIKIRPQAMEAITISELSTVDSLIACFSATHESLAPTMRLISDKNLVEPYYVPTASYNANFLNTTGIQPRVNEIGQFYIISSVNGKGIKHNSITLKSASGEVSTAIVAYDGDSNYRSGNSEMITYLPEQCDTLGVFVNENLGNTITLTFNGESGKKISDKLSKTAIKGIADAYNFSKSVIMSRDLAVKRQKLERQLQIARDQIARTTQE